MSFNAFIALTTAANARSTTAGAIVRLLQKHADQMSFEEFAAAVEFARAELAARTGADDIRDKIMEKAKNNLAVTPNWARVLYNINGAIGTDPRLYVRALTFELACERNSVLTLTRWLTRRGVTASTVKDLPASYLTTIAHHDADKILEWAFAHGANAAQFDWCAHVLQLARSVPTSAHIPERIEFIMRSNKIVLLGCTLGKLRVTSKYTGNMRVAVEYDDLVIVECTTDDCEIMNLLTS